MIENYQDEKVCEVWDVLADEDQPHLSYVTRRILQLQEQLVALSQ